MNDKIEWVLVPKEPTTEMLDAAAPEIPAEWKNGSAVERDDIRDAWDAMLAAAPKPEAQAAGGVNLLPMPSKLLNAPHPVDHMAIREYAMACVEAALATTASHDEQQEEDDSTDYRCPDCGKLNYKPLGCANCGYELPAQQPAVVGDGVRDAFEQWVAKRHGCALDRWADSGKYRYDNTNAWWECWQAALTPAATPGDDHIAWEWRWVDEKDRAMTAWERSDPPPMLDVSDSKGTMRVEVRIAQKEGNGNG